MWSLYDVKKTSDYKKKLTMKMLIPVRKLQVK